MPHPTSIAGRHAADRERQRAAERAASVLTEINAEAREQLRRAIAAHGIRVIEVLRDGGTTLSVRCGIDTCARDSELVDAIITDQGWTLDPKRLSRFRDRFELVRLHQPATGARTEVLISRPGALQRGEEAA